ncbi:hypothetical protein FPQ18DRAFT_416878 [Pyronema domesticum]|nr:hypothetical protein FPQ18DRAFT_416878 [Pyronema domesticum]
MSYRNNRNSGFVGISQAPRSISRQVSSPALPSPTYQNWPERGYSGTELPPLAPRPHPELFHGQVHRNHRQRYHQASPQHSPNAGYSVHSQQQGRLHWDQNQGPQRRQYPRESHLQPSTPPRSHTVPQQLPYYQDEGDYSEQEEEPEPLPRTVYQLEPFQRTYMTPQEEQDDFLEKKLSKDIKRQLEPLDWCSKSALLLRCLKEVRNYQLIHTIGKNDLLKLRGLHRGLRDWLTPILMEHLHVEFTSKAIHQNAEYKFADDPVGLKAGMRKTAFWNYAPKLLGNSENEVNALPILRGIVKHCRKMTFHLEFSEEDQSTNITLVPLDPMYPRRITSMYPIPRNGKLDEEGNWILPNTISDSLHCNPADMDLFNFSLRTRYWKPIFVGMQASDLEDGAVGIEELEILTKGWIKGQGLARNTNDEFLQTICYLLNHWTRFELKTLTFIGYANALRFLDPMGGWDRKSSKRGWWRCLTHIKIHIDPETIDEYQYRKQLRKTTNPQEKLALEQVIKKLKWGTKSMSGALRHLLEACCKTLKELEVHAEGLESPFTCTKRLKRLKPPVLKVFSELQELKINGFEDLDWSPFKEWLDKQTTPKLRRLFIGSKVLKKEDWRDFYRTWELPVCDNPDATVLIVDRKQTLDVKGMR